MHKDEQEKKQKLLQLVRDAITKDQALRDQYGIGDKFRFIRDKLKALLVFVEAEVASTPSEVAESLIVHDDERIVYVYLFNSQGVSLASWRKMVHESVFYEYSINRPIYVEKSQIDSLIRGRANKLQHGYLSVIVKKQDVIETPGLKDAFENRLVKVREGSLKRANLLTFTHGNDEYDVTIEGDFIKREK